MNIDWFTFTAQIVNFLVLVVLLKRFLYGPIIAAMQQREEAISARLEQASETQRLAEQETDLYRRKNCELDEQRQLLLAEAKRDAEETRKQLTREAREEVQRKHDEWQEAVFRQRESLIDTIRKRAAAQVTAATRRTLQELAGVDLEQRLAERFLGRIRELAPERRQALADSLLDKRQPAVVRTAFELPAAWQTRIRSSLQEQLGIDGELIFTTSPEVICGIELLAAGYKLAWSANDFLSSLDDEMRIAMPDK